MQYCSLQHQTLLLSPVTSTTGYCFCFGSIPSSFLKLFLHWSPVAYWAPTKSSHVWMWELDYKESWVQKNWCIWTVVLEKTIENPLDCKEIKPVYLKGNQAWIFMGRTDAEGETPILWPPNVKNWLIKKDPDAGKDWRQEEKGTTEDGMVEWHHWLDGHEFEQARGVGDGQRSLVSCSPWGVAELDTIERLNWNDWSFQRSWANISDPNC